MEASGQITAIAQPLPEMKNDGVVTKQYAQIKMSKVDDIYRCVAEYSAIQGGWIRCYGCRFQCIIGRLS